MRLGAGSAEQGGVLGLLELGEGDGLVGGVVYEGAEGCGD